MAADKGPLHQFEINKIFDINLYDTDISFTNSALSMVIAISLAIIIYFLGSKKNGDVI